MDHSPILAIIVPCFCEEEVLPSTNERLRALLADMVTRGEVSAEAAWCMSTMAVPTPLGHC